MKVLGLVILVSIPFVLTHALQSVQRRHSSTTTPARRLTIRGSHHKSESPDPCYINGAPWEKNPITVATYEDGTNHTLKHPTTIGCCLNAAIVIGKSKKAVTSCGDCTLGIFIKGELSARHQDITEKIINDMTYFILNELTNADMSQVPVPSEDPRKKKSLRPTHILVLVDREGPPDSSQVCQGYSTVTGWKQVGKQAYKPKED